MSSDTVQTSSNHATETAPSTRPPAGRPNGKKVAKIIVWSVAILALGLLLFPKHTRSGWGRPWCAGLEIGRYAERFEMTGPSEFPAIPQTGRSLGRPRSLSFFRAVLVEPSHEGVVKIADFVDNYYCIGVLMPEQEVGD